MFIGAHSIIYSRKPEADRDFLRDVLELPSVDAGDGWLIFGLPPSELGIHPSGKNDVHEFYLMCDDIAAFVQEMRKRHVSCSSVQDMGWGRLTHMTLPGGGKLGVYQPRHVRPKAGGAKKSSKRTLVPAAAKASKRTVKRTTRSRARAR